MSLCARLLQRPKVGESAAEMQDAGGADAARGLAAIADGATDSAFQRLWAELLVQGWLEQPPPSSGHAVVEVWLAARRAAWWAAVPWARLPWHGHNKAQGVGALATFLGAAWDGEGWAVELFGVGDCGALVVGAEPTLHRGWPHEASDAFNSTPALLSSLRAPEAEGWAERVDAARLELAPGELLLLCTDAAFAWLLAVLEHDRDALGALARLLAQAAEPLDGDGAPADAEAADLADALIARARSERTLRNDDLTLLFLLPA